MISVGQVAQKSVQKGDPPAIFSSECDVTDMTRDFGLLISRHGRRPVSTIVLHLKRKSLFWRLPSVDNWGAIGSNLGRDAAN